MIMICVTMALINPVTTYLVPKSMTKTNRYDSLTDSCITIFTLYQTEKLT